MTTQKILIGIDDQIVEAKGEVLANLLLEIEEIKANQLALEEKETAKETDKIAILARLGITAEEAKLLLG